MQSMCVLNFDFTLHEVRYFVKHEATKWMQVSKNKRTPVSFDRETSTFVGLDQEILAELTVLFPGVNLRLEFLKMSDWLCTTAGKERKGSMQFITNRLSRSPVSKVAEPLDPSLTHLVNIYLKDAWKTHDYLETLNTKRP